ncbi:hypothetical protein GGX14DRAFT_567879 [Mycena pura]|uniref:Uncharacterized protein n=1 Tax=Mycena pura TaxID=153505 RepID=A0AAD6V9S6_9AGAR|nr:hypothetical protein GGX14DRAFT_567879 [Mycena pura]
MHSARRPRPLHAVPRHLHAAPAVYTSPCRVHVAPAFCMPTPPSASCLCPTRRPCPLHTAPAPYTPPPPPPPARRPAFCTPCIAARSFGRFWAPAAAAALFYTRRRRLVIPRGLVLDVRRRRHPAPPPCTARARSNGCVQARFRRPTPPPRSPLPPPPSTGRARLYFDFLRRRLDTRAAAALRACSPCLRLSKPPALSPVPPS